jgi:hypothetical protein
LRVLAVSAHGILFAEWARIENPEVSMNRSLTLKVLFICVAVGFAVSGARAGKRDGKRDGKKEMKRVAKLINGTKWKRGCKVEASKDKDPEGRDWDLDVSNFYEGNSETIRLETCDVIGSATHCIRSTEIPAKKNKKDCVYDRLVFSPADANRPAEMTTESVVIGRVKDKRKCIDVYFDSDGKEDSTRENGYRCEGKRSE